MLRREWPLLVSAVTTALFYVFGSRWFADLSGASWFALLLAWLFAVILLSAFAVVRHAERLAGRLGEPFGTLILTLAVTGIEVIMIAAVMYTGRDNPAFARDAMFAVVMIVMNGMVGLALVLGGLRHHEQNYNLQGANAFLAVIVPLAVLCLVLPNFTVTSPGPTYSGLQSAFLVVMSLALYGVFLAIQNLRHRDYFIAPGSEGGPEPHAGSFRSIPFHGALLIAHLLPVVLLAKQLAVPINYGIHEFGAPAALGGLLVSTLVLCPESMGAIRAALANELQRAVNILLGSVLATISLTIPAVLVIGLATGQEILLGLDAVNMILLVLTLAVSTLTFASARTNVLLGAVHLLLFLAYLVMVFDR
ncbi:MAG TPA: ionic transporter y4hA [Burkholderiales bacterium]|nr:ionic transporter y4hA [Burkholderiales bacterium]